LQQHSRSFILVQGCEYLHISLEQTPELRLGHASCALNKSQAKHLHWPLSSALSLSSALFFGPLAFIDPSQ